MKRNHCHDLLVFCFLIYLLFFAARLCYADVYSIDPNHSNMGFSVKHLGISNVVGSFSDFKGTLNYDPEKKMITKADIKIKVNSIDTNIEARDRHLLAADFFHAEKFPVITFESQTVEGGSRETLIVGNLTIKGVTKNVSILVEMGGPVEHPKGGEAIGLTGSTTINRLDFNVGTETPRKMVSDAVQLQVSLQAKKQE